VPQPWLPTEHFENVIDFLRIELACQKMRSVVCALFVVNRLSLKSIAVGKCGNILSCDGGQSLKPAVAQDAGVTRYFDDNVFKTKPETERPASFIFPGNNRARGIDVVKATGLADRSSDQRTMKTHKAIVSPTKFLPIAAT
jgi:hypothetical protein